MWNIIFDSKLGLIMSFWFIQHIKRHEATWRKWSWHEAAWAFPNPRWLNILKADLFLDLKISDGPSDYFNHSLGFQQNLMIIFPRYWPQSSFWTDLGPKFGPILLFQIPKTSLIQTYFRLAWCKISEKSNDGKYENLCHSLSPFYRTSRGGPKTCILQSGYYGNYGYYWIWKLWILWKLWKLWILWKFTRSNHDYCNVLSKYFNTHCSKLSILLLCASVPSSEYYVF